MKIREIFEENNYHFICEYPSNKHVEKIVSYTCDFEVVDNSIKFKKAGRIEVYMRNGDKYLFDAWPTVYCSQWGISVSDDGKYIYVISDLKGLWCYTYDGKIVWKTRYTSVTHTIVHSDNKLTCIMNKKLAVIDLNGKIVNQRPIMDYKGYKASEDYITANTSENIIAVFNSKTLDIIDKISIKDIGLKYYTQSYYANGVLTIKGKSIYESDPYPYSVDIPFSKA